MWRLWFFLFFPLVSLAQHSSVVRPIKTRDVFEFTRYQYRQKLNDLFKKTKNHKMISSQQMYFEAPQVPCRVAGVLRDAELQVVRETKITASGHQQMIESLFLKACKNRIEMMRLKRTGSALTPMPDSDLLIGKLPDYSQSQSYQLSLNQRQIYMEIKPTDEVEDLFFEIAEKGGNPDIQIYLKDHIKGDNLARQALIFLTYSGVKVRETHQVEYIWSPDLIGVPRQYLYYQNNEITPDQFIELLNDVFNNTIYPEIVWRLNFFLEPL